jgi:hypothetical protein
LVIFSWQTHPLPSGNPKKKLSSNFGSSTLSVTSSNSQEHFHSRPCNGYPSSLLHILQYTTKLPKNPKNHELNQNPTNPKQSNRTSATHQKNITTFRSETHPKKKTQKAEKRKTQVPLKRNNRTPHRLHTTSFTSLKKNQTQPETNKHTYKKENWSTRSEWLSFVWWSWKPNCDAKQGLEENGNDKGWLLPLCIMLLTTCELQSICPALLSLRRPSGRPSRPSLLRRSVSSGGMNV